jgi:hypothetical protein
MTSAPTFQVDAMIGRRHDADQGHARAQRVSQAKKLRQDRFGDQRAVSGTSARLNPSCVVSGVFMLSQ